MDVFSVDLFSYIPENQTPPMIIMFQIYDCRHVDLLLNRGKDSTSLDYDKGWIIINNEPVILSVFIF